MKNILNNIHQAASSGVVGGDVQLLSPSSSFFSYSSKKLKSAVPLLLASIVAPLVNYSVIRMIGTLVGYLEGMFCSSLQISNHDDSYEYLLEWLNEQRFARESRHVVVNTAYLAEDEEDAGARTPVIWFSPATGNHFFKYKGKAVWLRRDRETTVDYSMAQPLETITLTTFGRNTQIFRELVTECTQQAFIKLKGKTNIYACKNDKWRKIGRPMEMRPIASIVLDRAVKDSIVNDINVFMQKRNWYKTLGIPYRRGYFFYGPPGSGKTSLIKALAGHFNLDICLLNLSNKDLTDDILNILFNDAPRKSIIVIEDADVVLPTRRTNQSSNITLSGLLNAIDGIASQEGRLLFITTNKDDEIDVALKRPGRIDKIAYFGLITTPQIAELFQNFFPNATPQQTDLFAHKVPSKVYSVAELQKYLIVFQHDVSLAINWTEKIPQIILDDYNLEELEEEQHNPQTTIDNSPNPLQ